MNLLDSDAPGPDVVERAVAAVTREGVVYHVLERCHRADTGLPDAGRQTFYFESWHTTGGRVHRKTFAASGQRRGKLLEEFAGRRLPGRRGGPLLRWDAYSNTISEAGFAVGSDPNGPPSSTPSRPGHRAEDTRAARPPAPGGHRPVREPDRLPAGVGRRDQRG